MARIINLKVLFVSITFSVVAAACGYTSATKSEKIEGIDWDVTVNEVVTFNDTLLGVGTDYVYKLADTARVNEALKSLPQFEDATVAWTLPTAEGSIWLVLYNNEPLLSENVGLTEANSIQAYGGDIQVAFKFKDAEKWATITRNSIGQRLALVVNGRLINAPQVNSEISSGNCSVAIPADKILDYLPDLDLEKLKQ